MNNEIKKPKRINLLMNDVQQKINTTHILLTQVEDQLYPVLKDLRRGEEKEEDSEELTKLDEKINDTGIEIRRVNKRLRILLDALMIEKF